jgi:hypothetical protein
MDHWVVLVSTVINLQLSCMQIGTLTTLATVTYMDLVNELGYCCHRNLYFLLQVDGGLA